MHDGAAFLFFELIYFFLSGMIFLFLFLYSPPTSTPTLILIDHKVSKQERVSVSKMF